jgi:RHS repeat-associated protein
MKFKLKHMLKITATLLALTMLIEIAPLDALATANASTPDILQQLFGDNEAPNIPPVEEPTVVAEIESLRTEDTATYLMSDGTYTLAQYESPIFYKDTEGTYQEIDNTLQNVIDTEENNTQVLENNENPLKITFSKKLTASRLVKIKSGNYKLTWGIDSENETLSNADAIIENTSSNMDAEDELQAMAHNKSSSSLTYKNMIPGVDLKYIISSGTLKENIVVKQAQDTYSYDFLLGTDNLTAEKLEDGSIRFFDAADHTKEVYNIPAPYMFDAQNSLSDAVAFTLEETETGYRLNITADTDWINDPTRTFPVTIDPEVEYATQTGGFTTRTLMSSTQSSATGYAYVGYQTPGTGICQSYFKFNTLPALKSGDVITSAKFYAYQFASTASPAGFSTQETTMSRLRVHAHEVTSAWSTSTTWSTRPSIASDAVDYNYTPIGGGAFVPFDITKLARKWYDNPASNFGFVLRSFNEANKTLAVFNSSASSGNVPYLTVSYNHNNKGLEDYWTFMDYELQGSGTAHVNYYNGSLTYELPDFAGTGNRMPASMSHIYNSQDAGLNTETVPYIGKGWHLSTFKTLEVFSSTRKRYDSSGNVVTEANPYWENYNYLYIDADGTQHLFNKDNEDEDGLGLKIVNNGQGTLLPYTGRYTISDSSGNTLEFTLAASQSGTTYGPALNPTSYPLYEKDTSGNRISYSYNGYKQIKTKDGADRNYPYTLGSDDYINTVTDPAGRTINYSYTDGKLTSVQMPAPEAGVNVSTSFVYDSANRLTKVTNPDGQYLEFEYDSFNRVIKVTEGGGSSSGQYLNLSYPAVQTTVVSDSSDNSITYAFDRAGRMICVYDDEGNAESAGYSNTGKSKNKLTQSALPSKAAVNLLKDPSVENSTSGWSAQGVNSGYTTATINTSASNAYLGNRSIKLTSNDYTKAPVMYHQSITLPAGMTANDSLTLSAYVKTNITATHPNPSSLPSGHQSGATLYVIQQKADVAQNEPDIFSKVYVTDAGGDWKRISFTFKPYNVTKSIQIRLGLTYAAGTAYFDCIQLEKSDTVGEYNLIENSSFEQATSNLPDAWSLYNGGSGDEVITPSASIGTRSGSKVFAMGGAAGANKSIYQNIPIGNGSQKDTYTFSGWAKANSTGQDINNTEFALDVTVYYSNNTSNNQVYRFNSYNPDWQYISAVVDCSNSESETATATSLRAHLVYNNELNTAYFDDVQLTHKSGEVTTYDTNGNSTGTTSAGTQTTDVYDSNNNLTFHTDETGTTAYTYDSQNRLRTTTTPDGLITGTDYTTYGNVEKSYTKYGDEYMMNKYQYTSNGNYITNIEDEACADHIRSYNLITGTLTSSQDSNYITTSYGYDNLDRCTSISSQGVTQSYSYSPAGHLLSITQNGMTYNFEADDFGNQLTTKIGTSITLSDNEYAENNGDWLKSTYGNGQYEEPVYDSKGRITETKWNGTATASYEYNSKGNVKKLVDLSRSATYNYKYDDKGILTNVSGTDGTDYIYHSNAAGQTDSVNYKIFAQSSQVSYVYDANGKITRTNFPGGAYATSDLDKFGRKINPTVHTTAGTDLITSYEYEVNFDYEDTYRANNRIESITNAAGETWSYIDDNNGNITSVWLNGDSKVTYKYDGLNRLTRENNVFENATYTYTYDNSGNLTAKNTHDFTWAWSIGPILETQSYDYDDENGWDDKLTAYNGIEITYDDGGNPLTYNGYTFTWQRGRQLATASNGTNIIAYQYNDEGIRTQKTVNGVVHKYFLDGDKVIQEQIGTNDVIWYYYDSDDSLVGFELNGTNYYYARNAQSDITAIVNSTGTLVASYKYDAWGNIIEITGNTAVANINPYRYRGYRYDSESNLYYLQSRYYDPVVGRFLNADAAGVLDQESSLPGNNNLFSYCGNNPVMNVDPSGYITINQIASSLYPAAILLLFMTMLYADSAYGLVAIGGYVLKLITPIVLKSLWWKPALAAAIIAGAVILVVIAVKILFAKGGKQNKKDSGLTGLSNEELKSLYHNKNTPTKLKQRIKTEQKARDTRRSSKRK